MRIKKTDRHGIPVVMFDAGSCVVVLCNFRRYGWAWSRLPDSFENGQGFSEGPTWPNGDALIAAGSPEEFIRLSLAHTVGEVSALGWRMRTLLGSEAGLAAIRELLDEACSNERALACARDSMGNFNHTCADVEVIND